jgi:hypothetical protein
MRMREPYKNVQGKSVHILGWENISLKIFHFNGLFSYFEQYILVLTAVGKTRG